jgi:hypothetical protein
MIYELWDTDEASLINTYTNLSDALAVVAGVIRDTDEAAVAMWGLFRATPAGDEIETIAAGRELARLAMAETHAGHAATD